MCMTMNRNQHHLKTYHPSNGMCDSSIISNCSSSSSSRGNDNANAEAPKSLSQVLLPQLSMTYCLVSLLLLSLVHATHFLEDKQSTPSSYCRQECNIDQVYQSVAHQDSLSFGSSFTIAAVADTTLTILQSRLFGPASLLLFTLAALLRLQYTRLCDIVRTTSPVPGIDPVPNANPYMGHYSMLLQPHLHPVAFVQYATPSGISALWGPGLKRCASVLLASHARLILRHNSQRDFSDWIIRHGRKTLGEDSLILITGGSHWKNVRKVVARAFTNRIVRNGRRVIGGCAVECVDWLKRAVDSCATDEIGSDSEGRRSCCPGHGVTKDGKKKGTVCLEAEDFFKLFSLNAFGRVAMGHDFQCFPASGNSCSREEWHHCKQTQHSSCDKNDLCNCLSTPPEARAFEALEADIGLRATPASFINPAMQFYWIPTKYNRTYKKNKDLVEGLMEEIIGRQLDSRLEKLQQKQEEGLVGSKNEKVVANEDSSGEAGSASDSDSSSTTSSNIGETSENMVTHLLKSCMEQHFTKKQQESAATDSIRRASSLSSSESSLPTGCPFASTSSTDVNPHTSPSKGIPLSSEVTDADKHKIIQDVANILHTLLVAGYETTALSLSYVMYCLSKNPRCQERCCEEARRVMSKKSSQCEGSEMDVDDDDLPYCRAVLTESIRLHLPILFTTRVLSKDLTLDTGYNESDNDGNGQAQPHQATLLKGTRVMINPSMIHLDERNFVRAADFVPERWVRWDEKEGGWVDREYDEKESEKSSKQEAPASPLSPSSSPRTQVPTSMAPSFSSEYTNDHSQADAIPAANPNNFFSFSDGARNCVGRRLAIMESTICIATLFRDMCVGIEDPNFELVKERRFVTVKPVSLPIVFWKR